MHPLNDGHGILGFSGGASPMAAAPFGANRASGLPKTTEAAMELALIRPDLVSPEQVQTIAQALKNATLGRANLAQLEAAMRQPKTNTSYQGHGMQVLSSGGIAHR